MKRWNLSIVIIAVTFINTYSQTKTIRDVLKNPRNIVDVTVNGKITAKKPMGCSLVACQNCCNTCIMASIKLTDSVDSIDIAPGSPFTKKFFEFLTVSECHQNNLNINKKNFICRGSGMVVTVGGPPSSTSEFAAFNLSEISVSGRSLIYPKDTVFADPFIANKIDPSITIMNPTTKAITIDSIFADSLELTDARQGLSVTVADTSGASAIYRYEVVAINTTAHKYLFRTLGTEDKKAISVPANSWVTLSDFGYTSNPDEPGTGKKHPPFTWNITLKDSKKESTPLILKFSEIIANPVQYTPAKSIAAKRSTVSRSVSLSGRKICSANQNAPAVIIRTDRTSKLTLLKHYY